MIVCRKHANLFPKMCSFMGITDACKKMGERGWQDRETESLRNAKKSVADRPFAAQSVGHNVCLEVGTVRSKTILNADEWAQVHKKNVTQRLPKPSDSFAYVLKDDGTFEWEKVLWSLIVRCCTCGGSRCALHWATSSKLAGQSQQRYGCDSRTPAFAPSYSQCARDRCGFTIMHHSADFARWKCGLGGLFKSAQTS